MKPFDDENVNQAIELRTHKQKHSDFFFKLHELKERIAVFNEVFRSKQPRYIRGDTINVSSRNEGFYCNKLGFSSIIIVLLWESHVDKSQLIADNILILISQITNIEVKIVEGITKITGKEC